MENTNDKQFNDLEKAVLEWYVATYQDDNLTAQIKSAKPVKRDWTGHGFFTDLEVSNDLKPIDFSTLKMLGKSDELRTRSIDGPCFKPSDDIELGGGSVLFVMDGHIDCLEFFAIGHIFKEHVTNFELCDTLEGISIAPTSPSLTTSPMEKLKRVIGFFKK